MRILYVISAYSIHFTILKSGSNQDFNFFIDNFNLQAPKWVGLIEKMTVIAFLEIIFTPSLKNITFNRTK